MTQPTILVAGATGVLGQGIVELLRPTTRLVLSGRDPQRLAGVTTAHDVAIPADLARPDGAEQLIAGALAANGRLDGVVVASGVVAFGGIEETADDVLIRLFTTNTLGPIRLLRAALPALTDAASAGGSPFFCAISAVVAEQPVAGMAGYSASKAALSAHLAAARRELRRRGVRVIDVRPPHTETGLAQRPVAGVAPRLPVGLDPAWVSARIVDAIRGDETEVSAAQFAVA